MKKITGVILLILLAAALAGGCAAGVGNGEYRAKVIGERSESSIDEAGDYVSEQHITLEFLEGPYTGQVFEASVYISSANYTDIAAYRVGDRVEAYVFLSPEGQVESVGISTLVRVPYVIILAVLFLALIAIVARIKGLKTIIALVFTVCAVVFLLVPLITHGYDPILSATLVCIVITVVTMFTVGGFNEKAISAVLGTMSGLVCAGAVTLIFGSLMRITGVETSEVGLLMIADTGISFNYQGILTAGILIGCIGAVMDVAMSISSSLSEMAVIDPALTSKQLFASGMSVGRDIIGTMANTLILAYVGGSIMLMVVWSVYGVAFVDMLNKGFIVLEIAKSLCGSIGMIMTIPLTALIASRLVRMSRIKKEHAEAELRQQQEKDAE